MKHVNLDLRKAKAEIKAVMERYDIGGLVSLHNMTHTEFELFLPKWSVAQFENKNGEVGIRFKHKGPDKEDKLAGTVHFMLDCQEVCQKFDATIGSIGRILRTKMVIEREDFDKRD